MKADRAIMFVCCMSSIFIHPCLTTAEEDGVYETMLQEFQTMMRQVRRSRAFVKMSCKNNCNESYKNRKRAIDSCHCDKQCVAYGDCCLDYWKSCNSSFSEVYDQKPIFRCLLPKLKLSNTTTGIAAAAPEGIQVVIRCPSNYQNSLIKNACENPHENDAKSLPFVSGEDGTTYRNQYCAKCHAVVHWKQWNTELECRNEIAAMVRSRLGAKNYTFSDEERKKIRETCGLLMKPVKDLEPTQCRRTLECEDTTSPNYSKCFAYKQQLYFPRRGTLPVRNPHCAQCSKIVLRLLFKKNIRGSTPPIGNPRSLGILFDFSKASAIYGTRTIKPERVECKTGEVYDFKLKACRAQRIVNKASLGNWTCEYGNETFPNTSTHIVLFENRSIFVPAHNKIYQPSQYQWQGSNVTVCGNLTTQYMKATKWHLGSYTAAEYYITLVGLSLSILALLAVLLTYSLFHELRRLPGKIIINLAVALLLSQLVFLFNMVKDVSGSFCTGLAVVLQYLYIAAFCWMNAMAFDVSRTFAGKGHRSPSGSRQKVFLSCLLYGWGLPLIIVGITLAVNHSGTMDVAYGNDFFCWITNPIALAIFFVGPVIAMLLFNIVALVRVVIAVRRVRKVTKKVRDKSTTGQDVGMCWKLTAVFGLTWTLGVIQGYHIVLRILFTICNSLQGVFIMIGFIMTRRILNMYLKKAGKEPLKSRTTTQKSTVTTNTMVSRKSSSLLPMERKSSKVPLMKHKQREPSEEGEDVVAIDQDSPEAQLIASVEGPETKL